MANFANLKSAINAVIKQNGQGEITGEVMNQVLTAMVNSLGSNYQFAGVATPSTNPGTPDQNVFYMATQAGTYTNFSAIVLQAGISILLWDGSWSSETFFTVDSVPTSGSNNFITSGAVFDKFKLDGGAYDVSAHNNNATFADLSALLNSENLNTLIPVAVRHGGMSIKFVQTSDNKYVQYRYMGTEVTGSPNPFLDTSNWQDADDVKSVNDDAVDFSVSDENNNDIVLFKNGHIKTKEFDSSFDATIHKRGMMSTADKRKINSIEEGAEVNDTSVGEEAFGDLNIEDEEGNIVAGFSGGHIKTKKFDSKDIETRVNALEGREDYNTPSNYLGRDISTFAKIMCIGDSLTEGAFNYLSGGSFGNNTKASLLGRPYSYPQYLAKLTGCEVVNLGKSGYTSSQWYDYYTTGEGAGTDFSGYDCAIIQLGVNDNAATLDTVTKTALDNIINKVKTVNTGIKIFFAGIINAKSYPAATEGESYYAKDQWLRNYYNTYYANDDQVFFIDHVAYGHLRDLPNAQHGGSYPVDNYNEGHLSTYGYWRLAQDYVSMISYIMHNDQIGKFRKIQFIGTSYECY